MGFKLKSLVAPALGFAIGGPAGAFMAGAGLAGGSKGSGSKSQTVDNAPWAPQQPYLLSGFERAKSLLNAPQNTGYDPLQTQGQEGLLGYASGPAFTDAAGRFTEGTNFLTSTDLLDPASNPYLAKSAEAAIRPVTQALTEQWLPNIRSQAISAGGYGGSRQALAEGTAIGNAARLSGDITSNMFSDAYQRGLNTISGNLGQIPAAFGFGQLPFQTQMDIGGQRQDQRLFEQQAPWQQLQNYQNIVGGQPYGSQTTSPIYRNRGAGILGGAATGAAIGKMIPKIGPLLGAIGGGLLGGLG